MMRDGGYKTRRRYRRHLSIVICLLLIFVLSTTVAHAITIVVDGDRDTFWDGDGAGQTPGSVIDPEESDVDDYADIREIKWTNDNDNMYFMIDVEGALFMVPGAPVNICLDTDNNPATDINDTLSYYEKRCGYEEGVTGIDVIIDANDSGVKVYDATVFPPLQVGTGQLGYNPAAGTAVVEISVSLDLLNLTAGNCAAVMPMIVYMDNGTNSADDNTPDTETTDINCGTPTAVSMHTASAVANMPVSSSALLAGLFLTLVSGGVIIRRERHA